MGDLIVQTAAFAALRKRFPSAEIIVLCEERISVALSTNRDIDAVWGVPFAASKSLRGLKGLWRKAALFFSWARRIRAQRFSRVLVTDYNDKACLWAFFSGAAIRGGLKHQSMSFLLNHLLAEKEGSGDYIDFYLKLAGTIGATSMARRTSFYIPDDAPKLQRLIPEIGKIYFVIHPGASTPEKRWSAMNWGRLISKILSLNSGYQMILVSGPGEKALCDDVYAAVPKTFSKRVCVFAERPLIETAVVMQGARLVFCLDSASRHIAAALGTATISLVTRWILPTWGLYSENESHYILAADVPRDSYNIERISVNEVVDLFHRAIGKPRAAKR